MNEIYTFSLDTVEPKTFRKFENGSMSTYYYSIKRDRNGVELSRTEPEKISSIGFDNGKPFTESEYNRIMEARPQPTFIERVIKWLKK